MVGPETYNAWQAIVSPLRHAWLSDNVEHYNAISQALAEYLLAGSPDACPAFVEAIQVPLGMLHAGTWVGEKVERTPKAFTALREKLERMRELSTVEILTSDEGVEEFVWQFVYLISWKRYEQAPAEEWRESFESVKPQLPQGDAS